MKKQLGTKKMTLSRETLRALEAGETRHVNGGANTEACTPATHCISCAPRTCQ
jgi:hypothetical protein